MTMEELRFELLAHRYEARQGTHRTGAQYQPAIYATRGEAPSISRCSQIWSSKAQRNIQVLSTTEAAAAVFALYCPALVDLLEQRCLPLEPDVNPASLYSSPGLTRMPGMSGTLQVAERLGLTRFHPKFVAGDNNDRYHAPLPLVGDLLLILRDAAGAYAVNWTVKISEEAFGERLGKRPLRRRSPKSVDEANARHQLEEVCYRDAGIPTHRVVKATFDSTLIANLCQLVLWENRRTNLKDSARAEMVDDFRGIVGSGRSPLDLLDGLTKQFNCERHDCLVVLHQAIWRRELIFDLFKPFVINASLEKEKINPFQRYSHLFARGVQ
jgi:hypothetical protein